MTDTPSSRFGELPTLQLPSCLEFLKLKNFPLKVFSAVYEPPRPTKDTLFIYGPGYRNNQASFDVDCLVIQMYLKFCGIDFDVNNINEPAASPSEKLPFLATVSGAIYNDQEIINWVKETRNLEKQLANEKDREKAKAFVTLVETKLKAALLFSMWLEPLNANQTTYKSYYGHTPTPINMIVAYAKQKEIVQKLLSNRDILVREEIYQDAAQTLEALSVKLGDENYFFGASEPTYTDAIIFSYIHSILSMPKIVDGDFSDEERKQAAILSKLVRHNNFVLDSDDKYCYHPQDSRTENGLFYIYQNRLQAADNQFVMGFVKVQQKAKGPSFLC
ncbi:hypothetical protein [Parasitella parasitica]|uniref:Mitochondrial outer membrane transport complex Sam37/metaxin N-terminal domain-containing protein n=1 Tax=Parasitella parasitica TaxID=35722 RepID=A0A0B7NKB0_9FUNG|nr:hypothetical protein [Parasitella parasitica]